MEKKPDYQVKKKHKVKFIVSREFTGNRSMREAFEQVLERQAHAQYERWEKEKMSTTY